MVMVVITVPTEKIMQAAMAIGMPSTRVSITRPAAEQRMHSILINFAPRISLSEPQRNLATASDSSMILCTEAASSGLMPQSCKWGTITEKAA